MYEIDQAAAEEAGVAPAAGIDPAALWNRFHSRLLVLGMRRLGNRADAEDLAQETVRRVAEALGENRLREPAALPGFVFQTARHICLQWLRKRGRERRALEGYGRERRETEDFGHPLTDLIDEERRRSVRNALESLGAGDRALLEQLYAHDVDPDQLAERLRVTPGALRVRKHRALKRLVAALGDAAGLGARHCAAARAFAAPVALDDTYTFGRTAGPASSRAASTSDDRAIGRRDTASRRISAGSCRKTGASPTSSPMKVPV